MIYFVLSPPNRKHSSSGWAKMLLPFRWMWLPSCRPVFSCCPPNGIRARRSARATTFECIRVRRKLNLIFLNFCVILLLHLPAEPVDERVQRRSTVKLGIRLIHKICPVANSADKLVTGQPPTSGARSLRLRLSPKALKLSHKHSHSLDSSTGDAASKPIVEFDKKLTPSEVNKVSYVSVP